MKITLKLYASLKQYLPAGTPKNEAEIDIAEGTSVQAVLDSIGMPQGIYKLVLVNGVFIVPEERETRLFIEGDVFAIWPPVAGG
ncbi:MAG: MoaD/ThiS family protein [Alphaproteobacteria bacterium]|jgi:sulfur carrier protein ThiS